MKITKRQLRRIIKEEKAKLAEAGYRGAPAAGDIEPLVDELLGILQTMDPVDRSSEIYRIIDELETLAQTGE